LIPQGTKAIGTYDSRVAYGQERVLVVWTRLLRPDGSTLSLEGMPGTDLSGYAGLTGHVNSHYLRLRRPGFSDRCERADRDWREQPEPELCRPRGAGRGSEHQRGRQQITRKNLNIQPTIEVRPGARLNIFATKNLILPPWSE
jgi:type IV secretion system protein TrbI